MVEMPDPTDTAKCPRRHPGDAEFPCWLCGAAYAVHPGAVPAEIAAAWRLNTTIGVEALVEANRRAYPGLANRMWWRGDLRPSKRVGK